MNKKLKILIIILLIHYSAFSQSPHGDDFNVNCAICHSSEEWDLIDESGFDHDTTDFKLEGLHSGSDCRQCHSSLVFKDASSDCRDCHTDVHQNTVGESCDFCHAPDSWIVRDIAALHGMSRFPLTGAHHIADCYGCHPSASHLQFNVLGLDCYSCHQNKYLSTSNPDHVKSGYSTDCEVCHSLHASEWRATGFEHGFFPLIEGHGRLDCATCHGEEEFGNIPADCNECHASNYEQTTSPSHEALNFSQNCKECHTLSQNWAPARYTAHDAEFFPIYSGKHKGEWNSCNTCHAEPSNYSVFTCIECHAHNKSTMDKKHNDERDYTWESNECFRCHPVGKADD